jgi:outer membrane protein TolC
MISLELSAPIPLFYRGNQRAREREAISMRESREAEWKKARLMQQQELRDLEALWRSSVDCCRLEQGKVVPQAEAAWRSMLIDYRSGKATFGSLAEARMKVVMAEMELIMHKADGWSAYRRFQAAQGKAITL